MQSKTIGHGEHTVGIVGYGWVSKAMHKIFGNWFKAIYTPYVFKEEPFLLKPLQGAALMASREVWEKVGLLDEDYHFLFEDVDWSWRAEQAGVKLFLVPQAKITHLGGGSWQKKNPKTDFNFYCQHFDSFLLFVRKNYGERKLKIFRQALLLNFLSRFKFKLFRYFSQINL